MRSVALSPFLDSRPTPGQFRPSLQTALSFTRVLETLQNNNRAAVPSRAANQGQLQGAAPKPIPQLAHDPRFLPPLPINAGHLKPQQQNADSKSAQQQTKEISGKSTAVRTYGEKIAETALQQGIDPALSLAVARAESGVGIADDGEVILNPRAVSRTGAAGLFQLMAATGKEKLQEIAPGQRYNPFNPSQNIHLGVSYLKEMAETFSSDTQLTTTLSSTAGANDQEARRLAVAAYNAGPGRVARAQELARARGQNPAHYHNIERYLPRETRQYVQKVERFATEFRDNTVTLVSNADAAATATDV